MKYFFSISLILLLSFCNNKEEEAGTNNEQSRVDSISRLLAARDSAVSEFLASFNEIERTLDSVAKKQNLININVTRQKGEMKTDFKKRINSQISAINDLLEKNKKQIETLNIKLKNSRFKINEFQNIINTLNEQITQKNDELAALNDRLSSVNLQMVKLRTSLDTLSGINYIQSETISAQTASIQTAYYIVGKSKQLREMKIIDKSGGLLGMGKTAKLSPEFDAYNFTRIDYNQLLSIPLNNRKVKVVTTHPEDSYVLDRNAENMYTMIRIIKPEKFWSANKFLVIVTD